MSPMQERQGCEHCPQVEVMSGVVLEADRAFPLFFCVCEFLLSLSNSLTTLKIELRQASWSAAMSVQHRLVVLFYEHKNLAHVWAVNICLYLL